MTQEVETMTISMAGYAELKAKEIALDKTEATIKAMKQETYCAYCGATFPIDDDASKVSDHIKTCPHHPMRDVEQERDTALARAEVAEGLVAKARDVAAEASEAFRLTQEYLTPQVLPDIAGWSHYEARIALSEFLDTITPDLRR